MFLSLRALQKLALIEENFSLKSSPLFLIWMGFHVNPKNPEALMIPAVVLLTIDLLLLDVLRRFSLGLFLIIEEFLQLRANQPDISKK
jgi:hypothetical protein